MLNFFVVAKIRDLENKNTLEKEAQEKSQTIFDEEKLKLMDEIEKEKRARVEIGGWKILSTAILCGSLELLIQ